MTQSVYTIKSKGLITKKDISAKLSKNQGLGIRFGLKGKEDSLVEAKLENLSSTQRNTMLSDGSTSICLTEHFLAAAALMDLNDVDLILDESELPFGDGSAKIWIDFFNEHKLGDIDIRPEFKLGKESIKVIHPDDMEKEEGQRRFIKAEPCESFKVTYILEMDHPKIDRQEFSWELKDKQSLEDLNEIADARTFGSAMENKMFGVEDWIVSYTEDGFSMPLRFDDEPARHKALDLIGDLYLSGVNPLKIKAHIISYKGGHELNSLFSKEIAKLNKEKQLTKC